MNNMILYKRIKIAIIIALMIMMCCLFFMLIFHNGLCFAVPDFKLGNSCWINESEDVDGNLQTTILKIDGTGTKVRTYLPYDSFIYAKKGMDWKLVYAIDKNGEWLYDSNVIVDFEKDEDILVITHTNSETKEIEYQQQFETYQVTEADRQVFNSLDVHSKNNWIESPTEQYKKF